MSFSTEDVLDALELAAEKPSFPYLEKIFDRFNGRVPFESASKILRNVDVSDPNEKPRVPDIFWRDFLASGTGGTCFARVAAFDAFLTALGFSTRKALGRVEADFDHAALIVEAGGGEWIADVGFPLPGLVPGSGGEVETEIAALSAARTDRGVGVRFVSGVPEGARSLEVFRDPVSEEDFLALWRQTFRSDSRFLTAVSLMRRDGPRMVKFARGEVRVDDLHSRTRIPLLAERARRLSEVFGIDEDVLSRAFALAGDPEPEIRDARITAYLSVDADPGKAFDAIAAPDGYRRLMEGVADVAGEGWKLRFSPPGAAESGFEEEVTPDAGARSLAIVRHYPEGREVRLAFRVEEREGATYLVREAILSGAREDLLKNDYARGRLAGTLAVDLLAWSRLL
ncbi:MAG TPA: arylamine N-acetyltransferase [Thermoanaerobaculia bacterium]|nr:arylamine N-acetyltransferase [Thermoanaerobaculia bacterium]